MSKYKRKTKSVSKRIKGLTDILDDAEKCQYQEVLIGNPQELLELMDNLDLVSDELLRYIWSAWEENEEGFTIQTVVDFDMEGSPDTNPIIVIQVANTQDDQGMFLTLGNGQQLEVHANQVNESDRQVSEAIKDYISKTLEDWIYNPPNNINSTKSSIKRNFDKSNYDWVKFNDLNIVVKPYAKPFNENKIRSAFQDENLEDSQIEDLYTRITQGDIWAWCDVEIVITLDMDGYNWKEFDVFDETDENVTALNEKDYTDYSDFYSELVSEALDKYNRDFESMHEDDPVHNSRWGDTGMSDSDFYRA